MMNSNEIRHRNSLAGRFGSVQIIENPSANRNPQPSFVVHLSTCLDWMQKWSVKIAAVLYLIIVAVTIYWKWTTDPNQLRTTRFSKIKMGTSNEATDAGGPIFSMSTLPENFPIPWDFAMVGNIVDHTSGRIRCHKDIRIGKETAQCQIYFHDLLTTTSHYIFEAPIVNKELRKSESKSSLWMAGTSGAIEIMQYRYNHVIFEQIAGSTQIVLWNASRSDSCYPYPFGHPLNGQCKVNHSNSTRTEFPLFGDLLDKGYIPFIVELQPGQSLEIPALWMYELKASNMSISILRELQSELFDARNKMKFEMKSLFDENDDWPQDRLHSALSLFILHFQRRISMFGLIKNLIETRYGTEGDADLITISSCSIDGLTSNGATLAQQIRRQASTIATIVQSLRAEYRLGVAQDFIEEILSMKLGRSEKLHSFLLAFSNK